MLNQRQLDALKASAMNNHPRTQPTANAAARSESEALATLDAAARAHQQRHGGTYADAYLAVVRANAQAYKNYVDARRAQVGG